MLKIFYRHQFAADWLCYVFLLSTLSKFDTLNGDFEKVSRIF